MADIEIDFRTVLMMNPQSLLFNQSRALLDTYAAAGLVERVFRLVHENSYRLLNKSLSEQVINLHELKGLIINTVAIGSIAASIVFIIELAFWKFKSRRKYTNIGQ